MVSRFMRAGLAALVAVALSAPPARAAPDAPEAPFAVATDVLTADAATPAFEPAFLLEVLSVAPEHAVPNVTPGLLARAAPSPTAAPRPSLTPASHTVTPRHVQRE
jgi:hypothetical protein